MLKIICRLGLHRLNGIDNWHPRPDGEWVREVVCARRGCSYSKTLLWSNCWVESEEIR